MTVIVQPTDDQEEWLVTTSRLLGEKERAETRDAARELAHDIAGTDEQIVTRDSPPTSGLVGLAVSLARTHRSKAPSGA
jgi:hypothetical protein